MVQLLVLMNCKRLERKWFWPYRGSILAYLEEVNKIIENNGTDNQCAFQVWNTAPSKYKSWSLPVSKQEICQGRWIDLAQERDQLWAFCRSDNVPSNIIEGKYFIEQLSYCRLYRNGCTPSRLFFGVSPLWSSGQSSWLQIQRSGFDSRCYQIFWEVVGLERGPFSLLSTTEELLRRKSSGSGLEIREYGCRDPSRWPRGTLYPQKFELASSTSGGRSIGIVR
jgi:hypothetical protein